MSLCPSMRVRTTSRAPAPWRGRVLRRRGAPLIIVLIVLSGLPAAVAGEVPAHGPVDRAQNVTTEDGATACARTRLEAQQRALKTAVQGTEPTPEQRRFDALVYEIDLDLDPAAEQIAATALVRLAALEGPLDEIVLDLSSALQVDSVFGDAVSAQQGDGLLRLTLSQPLNAGEKAVVGVTYSGTPEPSSLHFDSFNGRPMIWSFSAPYGARGWWPCKDYPEDKADSVIVRVRVPEGLIAVSNGTLEDRQAAQGHETFVWKERHPIATYLVAVTAHPYSFYRDWYRPAVSDSMPLDFYNFPESVGRAKPVQDRLPAMIDALGALFGPYPFLDEKYGHAEFLFPGGMENQTVSALGSYAEAVVAHELTHQWWGDLVTCGSFHDIWLNEGFATYGEALWAEAVGGSEAYHQRMAATRYFGGGTVAVPDPRDPDRIYDRQLSYYKGSWILHMLRHALGEEGFSQALQNYRDRYAGSVASTIDFREAVEEVSGLDLARFFTQWVEEEGTPAYLYDWSMEPEGGEFVTRVRLRQIQEGPAFEMPVDIVLSTGGPDPSTRRLFQVGNAQADTTYTLVTGFEPGAVEIDPEEWILRRVYPPLPEPTFDRPVLLVNGVPWEGDTGAEVRRAYEAQAFTGRFAFDFWDYHPGPPGPYPGGLPAPLGHGAPPGDLLARYQAVVWVGNNYGGDHAGWLESPLYAYLERGGSLLLMTLSGRTFLPDPYGAYLGVTWAERDTAASVYRPVEPGLPDLRVIGSQDPVSTFRLDGEDDAALLYTLDPQASIGLGVLSHPEGKGRFAFLSGRPYRWHHDDLRVACETILGSLLLPAPNPSAAVRLAPPAPNPMRGTAAIRFFLPIAGTVRLDLFDVQGRRVRTLRDGPSPAGWNGEIWDGRTGSREPAPSGVYFLRLTSPDATEARRIVVLR